MLPTLSFWMIDYSRPAWDNDELKYLVTSCVHLCMGCVAPKLCSIALGILDYVLLASEDGILWLGLQEAVYLKYRGDKATNDIYPHIIIFLMSSQHSNERRSKRPLCQIALHARQLLRVNAQRAANWFKKPFPRFKLKSSFISSSRSHPSPYSHPSTTNDDSHSIQSSSTTLYSIRPSAPQTISTYNTRLVRTSPHIVPIMPTARLFLFTVCPRGWPSCFVFSSGSNIIHQVAPPSVMGSCSTLVLYYLNIITITSRNLFWINCI